VCISCLFFFIPRPARSLETLGRIVDIHHLTDGVSLIWPKLVEAKQDWSTKQEMLKEYKVLSKCTNLNRSCLKGLVYNQSECSRGIG
jgi:hypothetical protein